MKTVRKRRREEGKTDYLARLSMLSGKIDRVVFRKTNKHIIGQYISSNEAQDSVLLGVNSHELLEYGWPEKIKSMKNLQAAYLTGLLLGKRVKEKFGNKKAIFDIGLGRSIPKSKTYSFLKGVVDGGVNVACSEDIFPDEARLEKGAKSEINFKKIKEKILAE